VAPGTGKHSGQSQQATFGNLDPRPVAPDFQLMDGLASRGSQQLCLWLACGKELLDPTIEAVAFPSWRPASAGGGPDSRGPDADLGSTGGAGGGWSCGGNLPAIACLVGFRSASMHAGPAPRGNTPRRPAPGLNPRYVFNALWLGPNSAWPHAASLALAEAPAASSIPRSSSCGGVAWVKPT